MKKVYLSILFILLASPAFAAYSYHRSITIQSSQISGGADLTQFPILVCGNGVSPCNASISGLNQSGAGANVQNPNGYDIIFTKDAACTNLLTWEMEKYVASTGEFEAWVTNTGTPLSHTVNTTFYMCYGNSSVSSFQSTASNVWDSNYKAVYHMSDNAANTTVTDSTTNANGTHSLNTSTQATTGKVDGALNYLTTASYTTLPAAAALNITGAITISLWIKCTDSDGATDIIQGYQQGGSFPGYGLAISEAGIGKLAYFSNNSGSWVGGNTTINDNTWRYVAVTISSGGALTFYANGAPDGTPASAVPSSYSGIRIIGVDTNQNSSVGGTLDEIRISNINRSAGWIATEYNNQSAPSSFYTITGELSSLMINNAKINNAKLGR